MDLKEVKDLLQEILQSDISEFELEHSDTRVRLKRAIGKNPAIGSLLHPRSASLGHEPLKAATAASAPPGGDNTVDAEDPSLHVITSPIVGTAYRAPSPEAEPYVKLGDKVREGSVLCLVEAMKLMNEIPSDVDGEIVRIYFENAHPVEFGQKLFAIRPEKQG